VLNCPSRILVLGVRHCSTVFKLKKDIEKVPRVGGGRVRGPPKRGGDGGGLIENAFLQGGNLFGRVMQRS
jgi:hypothetical protein